MRALVSVRETVRKHIDREDGRKKKTRITERTRDGYRGSLLKNKWSAALCPRMSVCVFFCDCVCICAVHIPQSSGAQSMTRSVRLYGFESSVKLTLCVRGERLRCIIRRVSRFNVADWGMTLFPLYGWDKTGLNSKQVRFGATYCISVIKYSNNNSDMS